MNDTVKSGRQYAILGACALVVCGLALLSAWRVDGIRWRAEVVVRMAAGKIDDLSWPEFMRMILPGSGYYLEPLRNSSNPFAVITNPHTTPEDYVAGAQLFAVACSPCHGAAGEGEPGPALVNRALKTGDADLALFRVITGRDPQTSMPPVPLAEKEVWQVISHLRNLRLDFPGPASGARTVGQQIPSDFDVASERIERATSEPENWLTYSGSYNSWRYSELREVNSDNVAELKLAWSLQLDTSEAIETSPIVVDGIMFISEPASKVRAVDARTGEPIWQYSKQVPNDVRACCGRVNRGVAVLGSRVFIGTFDGYLVALDARTGNVDWQTMVADYRDGFSLTAAPLAINDMIVMGVAGGEFGIRGFLDAYDASSGGRRWRFATIPEPGQPGSETWEGDAWKTGGGPTWVTGSYDPELGLLYWGVGNPAPDFNGDVRPGDNLFTNSVVALSASSGERVWHFQFTPHDEHDWDANQIPVLVDLEFSGDTRRLMLWANRNGFYYVLDRATGEFLTAAEFVKQTWAEYIDPQGRPVLSGGGAPSIRGTLVWPGTGGGANWMSPSYSPRTNLFYTPFLEAPRVFFKGAEPPELRSGSLFLGSVSTYASGDTVQVGVRALEPTTGAVRWEYSSPPRTDYPMVGGVMTTSGDVLFIGDRTSFIAFDARTGLRLWDVNLGGTIRANPMTYAVNGRQHVAIPAGNTLFVFRL